MFVKVILKLLSIRAFILKRSLISNWSKGLKIFVLNIIKKNKKINLHYMELSLDSICTYLTIISVILIIYKSNIDYR